MTKARIVWAAAMIVAGSIVSRTAWGEITFTEFNWTGSVDANWQQDGNWSLANFPNAGSHSANIAVGSDLTLNLAATDVTAAALTMNGTAPGTDINIASTGGRLVLQNVDENLFVDPDGGIEGGQIAPVLTYVGKNFGRVLVTSNGAAGSTNVISAPVRLNNSGFLEGVDFAGNSSITLSGHLDIVGDDANDFGALRSYLPSGAKLLITGNISLNDGAVAATARSLSINDYSTTDHAAPPRGTVEITGAISGTGGIIMGSTWAPNAEQQGHDPAPPLGVPLSTIILGGNNTFSGDAILSRANVVLHHDHALGADVVRQLGTSGNSKEVGYNFVVDGGDRTIANNMAISQWVTIKGDSSLNWTGMIYQDGTRGLINLLSGGETLTLNGPLYPNRRGETPPEPGRIMTLDGSGRTLVSGGIHNQLNDSEVNPINYTGFLRKRGTGTVSIDWDNVQGTIPDPNNPGQMIPNPEDRFTDYTGDTYMEGGNLHFATDDDLPNGGEILSTGGAVGNDTSVAANSTFLGMLNNSSNPNFATPTAAPFFRTFQLTTPIFANYDSGGLMLAAGEYGQPLNFTSGPLANAANMTLAAHENGSTYTGTITPSSTVAVNKDTYQLGGGGGTLTLPNANQLTGARNLLVTNGGEVQLTNTNNYSGVTKVLGKFQASLQDDAANGTADRDSDGNYVEETQTIYAGTTLTLSTLVNGGAASSIGTSSNAATNLVIQGSTLKYTGGATSTDRLFTVGTAGATIDASGSGALNFTNTSALGIDVAENRNGVAAVGVSGPENNEIFGIPTSNILFSTEDLVPGMTVRNTPLTPEFTDDDSALVITSIPTPHVVRIGETDLTADQVDPGAAPNPWAGYGGSYQAIPTFDFGPAPARLLTLTGLNAANNTLASLIADAADRDEANGGGGAGGKGSVGIRKTGTGKWIVAGNNTYTGATKVEGGTLLINGTQSGNGLTTVSSGASFGGTGQIGGSLVMSEGSILTASFSGGTIDPLNVVGNVDLTAIGNVLAVTGSGVGSSWTLLTYTGALTGTFESASGFTVNYGAGTNSQITITAVGGVQGDYNGNGIVDAADYTVWRDHLGQTFALTNEGTGQTPGQVTIEDYNFWKTRFGATSGSGSGATSAVPEPASLVMVAFAAMCLGCMRRR